MKRVLFISTRDYDPGKEDEGLKRKFEGLSREMRVFVLARGNVREAEKYKAKFFLVPKWGTVIWMKLAWFRGLGIIRKHRIDTIVTQSPLFDGLVGAWLKMLTGKELIVEAHSDWIESLPLQHRLPLPGLFRAIFRIIGRFCLNRADKVRVVSTFLEKQAHKYAPKARVYKFAAYSNLDEFRQPREIIQGKTILFVGWLYRLKGAQYLLEAWAGLEEGYPDYSLRIIGQGPYEKTLRETAGKLGIERIEFSGWLEKSAIIEEMSHCFCLVLPSLSEGLGLVLIEAGLLKKPVVASRLGGIPDVVKDRETGYLFDPADPEDLKDKLERLLQDTLRAKQMGEAARKYLVENYSEEKYFKKYGEMIMDI